MMSRWYCLTCDACGAPGPLAATANEARKLSTVRPKWARLDGRDLCPDCKPKREP